MVIKVGCCGYPVSMKRYQEVLRVVELNNTFYQYPKESIVQKWRREAPQEFEFTVKANQEISHVHRLKIATTAKAFDKMKRICQILQTPVLLIQTPGSFTSDQIEDAYEFFKKAEREELILIWETRGSSWEKPEARERLGILLEEVGVPHVTDPFRIMPTYTGRVAYFRLHGLGKRMYYYQYTDDELEKLHHTVEPFNHPDCEVYVFFNNLSMFEDARRFLHFLENKTFPNITGTDLLDSIRKVIEGTRYPTTKSTLTEKLGWKLIISEKKQVRLEEILKELPPKRYRTAEEVIGEIKNTQISDSS